MRDDEAHLYWSSRLVNDDGVGSDGENSRNECIDRRRESHVLSVESCRLSDVE